MRHLTAKKFKLKFGMKVGKVFDLSKHLTPMHKVELMRNPTVAIVRAEFGTMMEKLEKKEGEEKEQITVIHYMLKVQWWLETVNKEERIRGLITDVCFFESEKEMLEYRQEYALMEKPLNQN